MYKVFTKSLSRIDNISDSYYREDAVAAAAERAPALVLYHNDEGKEVGFWVNQNGQTTPATDAEIDAFWA